MWERLSSRESAQRGSADRGWKAAPTFEIVHGEKPLTPNPRRLLLLWKNQ